MKKLLVIENDADLLELISFLFEDGEFELVKSRGIIAVDTIGEIKPDIILIDYLLDSGTGNSICNELKANSSTEHIPVILFSAVSNLQAIAKNCRADAFIEKPFDITVFEEKIRAMAL